MIRLDTLVALGQREKLGYLLDDQRPYGEVVLDAEGHIITVRKSSGAVPVPDLPNRTNSELRIGMYVENEMYLFGTTPKEYKDPTKPRKALEHAAEAYAKIAKEVRIKATQAVARFYDLSLRGKHKVPKGWRFQRYVFVYKDQYLPSVPQLRPVIEKFVDAIPSVDSIERQCLITGEWVRCQTTPHANTKGLSSNSSGASFVSFNGTSQYQGRPEDRFLTAPIAPGVSRLMTSALSWLSRNRRIQLTPDLNVLVWTEEGHPLEALGPKLFAPEKESREQRTKREEEAVGDLFAHPEWDESTEAAYLLTTTGNMGRFAVREWEETTVGRLSANLRRFVQDFTVEITVGEEEVQARHTSLSRLYAAWSDRQVVHRDILALANMALKGMPVPECAWPSGAPETIIQKAIFQAYRKRNMENPGNFTADISVDGQSNAYRMGRACAVMEDARYSANRANSRGVIAHNVVDNPSVGFHRAMQSIIHHLPKRPGNQYAESLSVFTSGIEIPDRFAVREQNEFWLGYLYEQGRQSYLYRLGRDAKSAKKSEQGADGQDVDARALLDD